MRSQSPRREPLDVPYEKGGKILAVIGFVIILSTASICAAMVLVKAFLTITR